MGTDIVVGIDGSEDSKRALAWAAVSVVAAVTVAFADPQDAGIRRHGDRPNLDAAAVEVQRKPVPTGLSGAERL